MTQSVVVIDPSLRSEELISSLVSVSNPDLSKVGAITFMDISAFVDILTGMLHLHQYQMNIST